MTAESSPPARQPVSLADALVLLSQELGVGMEGDSTTTAAPGTLYLSQSHSHSSQPSVPAERSESPEEEVTTPTPAAAEPPKKIAGRYDSIAAEWHTRRK